MSRHVLFDLAVARALSYATRLAILDKKHSSKAMHDGLELWYLKTRFAYRVPLEDIIEILQTYPNDGSKWQGGKTGKWQKTNMKKQI